MTPLRVLIADDEALARRRLRRLLDEVDGVEIAGECQDGADVLARVREGDVDVVLLDIQMPRLTGLDASALLPRDGGRPVVVFVTAFAEHAVEAFDRDAADYLLKPVEPDRLRRALDRARQRLAAAPTEPDEEDGDDPSTAEPVLPEALVHKLAVPTRKGVVLLDPSAISHAVLDGESCVIHAANGTFITDFRLTDLERRLSSFQRLHRKALVNLDHVVRLEPVDSGGYLAHLRSGEVVEVSRQAARRLRRVLGLPR